MNTATVEALPLSQKALKAIAASNTWDDNVSEHDKRSKRLAWTVAGTGIVLALLGFTMAAAQWLRPLPPPATIVVDRMTGETLVIGNFDADSVPKLSALDQHNAAVFVRARESYYFNLLQRDYDQVARMTTQETWAPYGSKFSGENAMQTKLGVTQEHRITIVSVRMSTSTKPGRNGEAIVTYDKDFRTTQGPSPATMRFVATVRFEYRPEAMKRPVDRIENPFGFTVLSYRSDAELLTPANPATPPGGAGGEPRQVNPT